MYIRNAEVVTNKYECKKRIANHLINKGIPLLSQKDGIFYFAQTENLQKVLDKLPWYLRLFK